MTFEKNYYRKYAKNIFTQNGDDGIIEKLFEDLQITEGVVVEFGAWDGIYLSNVYNLWKNKNFNAILIESDSTKALEMLDISTAFDHVECMNCFVSPDKNSPYSLDNLLKQSIFNVTKDNLCLVSIDIDSVDYYIFESLEEFLPKVVVIETTTFNPNTSSSIINSDTSGLKLMVELGEKKGYKLVCHNGNAYFVRNDLTHLLPKDADFSFESLHCFDEDVDLWQSLDQFGNLLDGERYYLQEEYQTLIINEKKFCKQLINESKIDA